MRINTMSSILKAMALAIMLAAAVPALADAPVGHESSADVGAGSLVALHDCKTGQEVWRATSDEPRPPAELAAAGFCERHGGDGNFYCKQGSCTGSCKFNNVGSYCTCE